MKEDLVCLHTTSASRRLILLHGWGADAEDLIPFGEIIHEGLKGQEIVEIVSLRAPLSHPGGLGKQWYSLFPPDWTEANKAVDDLQLRLESLSNDNISIEQSAIMGFSQGGAMALASGLQLPFAGVIACSAYPHPNLSIPDKIPPVFLSHGTNDEIVPCLAMQNIADLIKDNGFNAETELFVGGHEIPNQIILKIVQTLSEWFAL
ncbi:alpha/beta hydrolase [Prochlorococcus sp. MIT 1223]|uniref:alpha/beta hydrolase n=1 Tax=Prochlorococcus sp. MIT 1223 TaxID=3096217 RepID=UPI002A74A0FA|nr:alpha/beta fold hydrolase [Prochlorococcus sp. MIT 1223]